MDLHQVSSRDQIVLELEDGFRLVLSFERAKTLQNRLAWEIRRAAEEPAQKETPRQIALRLARRGPVTPDLLRKHRGGTNESAYQLLRRMVREGLLRKSPNGYEAGG